MNRSGRVEYLDIAKGIGIILVVLGHAYQLPHDWFKVIFSVHMPLFLMISGYIYHFGKKERFRDFLKKNVIGLLVPYVLTSAIIIILKSAMAAVHGNNVWEQIRLWGIAALYGSGSKIPEGLEDTVAAIGVIWFLLALFIGKMLLRAILNSRVPWLWALLLFLASYISTDYFWLPLSIQPGFCSVLFLYLGYAIGQADMFSMEKVRFPIRILAAAAWVYCIIFCGKLCVVDNNYEYPLQNLIGAICGIYTIIYISQLIEKYIRFLKRPLAFLGRISLGVMCTHLIALMCWPRTIIWQFMKEQTGWPGWICDTIDIVVMTAVFTAILYFIPWLNRYYFPSRFRTRKSEK